MKKIKVIGLFLGVLLSMSLSSCHKSLDWNKEVFGVKEFLTSKDAQTKCGEEAAVEGLIVNIKGVINTDYLYEDGRFELFDIENTDYKIEVLPRDEIQNEVYEKVQGMNNQVVSIRAVVKGFDAPTNFTCSRILYLYLLNVEDISTDIN